MLSNSQRRGIDSVQQDKRVGTSYEDDFLDLFMISEYFLLYFYRKCVIKYG
jgi:hypothetical protein